MLGQYRADAPARPRQLPRAARTRCRNDPAMMVWLDTIEQHEGQAERELRPRADGAVLASASATTPRRTSARRRGRSPATRSRTARASSTPRQHDAGEKTVFGKTGKFKGEDIVQHLPRTRRPARGSSSASCTASSSARPTTRRPELIDPLAEQFRKCELRHRQAGRDDAAVEPVLLAGRVPREDQVAGRVRRRASSAGWKARSARCRWPRRWKGWARCCSPRRRSRAGTAARPGSTRQTLLVPPQPRAGADLDRGRALRPTAATRPRCSRSTARRRDDEVVDFFLDAVPAGRRAGRGPRRSCSTT